MKQLHMWIGFHLSGTFGLANAVYSNIQLSRKYVTVHNFQNGVKKREEKMAAVSVSSLPPSIGARLFHFPPPPIPLPFLHTTRSSAVNRANIAATISSSPETIESGGATTCASSSSLSVPLFPNALRRKSDTNWRGGFSLGIDLGDSRTGIAIGKGFSPPRPHSVLELRGQKLEMRIMEIAQKEEVDEFIIGLPRSLDGKETPQSNKVRSIAGRLAVRAAERGWRVYLQDENGTTMDALELMINIGVKKHARRGRIDAYSAMMVLERYFSASGHGAELVLPKQLDLQEKLLRGSFRDEDFLPEDW